MTEDDDFDFLLSSFKKSSNTIVKTKEDYKSFMLADLNTLNRDTDTLMNNPEGLILNEIKSLNYRSCSNGDTSRLKFLLNRLSKDILNEYREYIKLTYPNDLLKEESKNLLDINKNIEDKISMWHKLNSNKNHTKELELEKRQSEKDIKTFNDFNARLNSLYATFNELIPEEVFGDESLDVTNMESVFFKFPIEADDKYLMVFIKEIRRIQSPHTALIKKVTIETNIVNFWFDTIKDAEKFYSTKTFVEGIYDKYVRRLSGHKVQLSWGVLQHSDSNSKILKAKSL